MYRKNVKKLTAMMMAATMAALVGSQTMTAFAEEEKTVIEYWHCNAETQGGLTVDELVEKFNNI